MYIAQIAEVTLSPRAADQLTKSAHDAASEWLKQWTAPGNFKAIVAANREQAVETLAKERLVPCWLASRGVNRSHFTFQIRGEKSEDGRFWMPLGLRICVDYPFSPEEPA